MRATRRRRREADRGRPFRRHREIPVDVEERSDAFVVTADLPGRRTQDIDVRVRKGTVEITANEPTERGRFGEREFVRSERGRGVARRAVRLPEWVDEKRVRAEYLDGVLRVELPKRRSRRADRPRRRRKAHQAGSEHRGRRGRRR